MVGRREEAQRQHVRYVPPGIRPQHTHQALRQQDRRDQQDRAECNLRSRQPLVNARLHFGLD